MSVPFLVLVHPWEFATSWSKLLGTRCVAPGSHPAEFARTVEANAHSNCTPACRPYGCLRLLAQTPRNSERAPSSQSCRVFGDPARNHTIGIPHEKRRTTEQGRLRVASTSWQPRFGPRYTRRLHMSESPLIAFAHGTLPLSRHLRQHPSVARHTQLLHER